MEAGFIVLMVVMALAVGVVVGVFTGQTKTKSSGTHGILNVDCSDPYEPNFFVAFTVPVNDVISQKQVTFEVNLLNQNSQK